MLQLKYVFSMERLKIEEIANNYGMHLKDFVQRKVLADQINFALDFGMEYYQGGFHFRPSSATKMRTRFLLVTVYVDILVTKHHRSLLKTD